MSPRAPSSAAVALLAALAGVPANSAAYERGGGRGNAGTSEPSPEAVADPVRSGEVEATYLYSLSTTFGPLPLSDVNLSWDPLHREIYVSSGGPVRVFNESGMEVFTFPDDPGVGRVLDIASMDDGDLVALSFASGGGHAVVRCTFRGEFLERIVPRGVPAEYVGFVPRALRYAKGKIYLADTVNMRILVIDVFGEYVASYDVAHALEEDENRANLGLRGFAVDGEGNMLFTIQPLFSAYTMSPDGKVQRFGKKGSAPGKFNVVGGIARDDAGNYYVVDILKSAVLVFDRGFTFRKEFGYRGRSPGSLSAPEQIVIGGDRLFISNRGRRGVSVFQISAR